ncbi:hypothetical protein AX17_006060 [Amanita inopinata Kibby_2008]|nr:hypothetical protein AX17_006060 [Amanita inopinata Kibby_2008]
MTSLLSPDNRKNATTNTFPGFSQDHSKWNADIPPPRSTPLKSGSTTTDTSSQSKSQGPLLFATPSSIPRTPLKKDVRSVSTPPTTPPRPGLGYFAFPSGSPPLLFRTGLNPTETSIPPSTRPLPQPKCRSNCHARAHSHTRNLEQAEAQRGEEAWVASGGLLRDAYGHVDWERTTKIREELATRKREKVLRERWNNYEEGWVKLTEICRDVGKGKEREREKKEEGTETEKMMDIRFGDIPWPVWVEDEGVKQASNRFTMSLTSSNPAHHTSTSSTPKRTITLEDITAERVEDFLLSPLTIRECTVTRKSRIRSSFLRWHPDKLGWLMRNIREEEVEDVMKGIGIIMSCLQRLNSGLRGASGHGGSRSTTPSEPTRG